MKELFIGLMSGTSVNSIDSVLINLSDKKIKILKQCSTEIKKELKTKILENWKGTRYFSYPKREENRKIFNYLFNLYPSGLLESQGSVIHSAIDLAVNMGAKRIFLAGVDFSFTNKYTHVAGTPRNEESRRFISGDHILNGYGTKNPTNLSMKGFLRDLENYIQNHPEIQFINCSKRGAKIEGADYC